MKTAIIGTGISGLSISYILSKRHQLTIYEQNDYIGGHSRTITPIINDVQVPIDTGFIVFNKQNYPNLNILLDHLDIPYSKSNMSFGVSMNSGQLEYGTSNLMSIFAQKSNIFNLAFWRMLIDICKFYKQARKFKNTQMTVGQMLNHLSLGHYFKVYFLLPMAGSIWSSRVSQILDFPASTLINFFDNHGLLSIANQPQWYSVIGGSKEYVNKIIMPFKEKIHLSRAAISVKRTDSQVIVTDNYGNKDWYDQIIFACHSDQVIKIIDDATDNERNILGNITYQKNKIIVHTDLSFMPQRKQCWSSWVYLGQHGNTDQNLSLTYWMNNLQSLNTDLPIFVTMNPQQSPDIETIIDEYNFEHPVFNLKSIEAQKGIDMIQGTKNSWYAGAYTGYGFHEDGILSAIKIAQKMEEQLPW